MSAYWKDLFREIKKTPGRFISLIVITILGAASVVGIQATSIDMRDVADKTYKERCLYDLQIKSSVGFDENDIAALRDTDGVADIMPANIKDVFISIENENKAVRTYTLPDNINKVEILDGRLPANDRECVVERRLMDDGEINLGDDIQLSLDNMDDYFDVFVSDTYTVVGVVSSPLYISFQRGNTTLGDGTLNYYLYLHPDAYKLEVYTDIYLNMNGSHSMDNLTDDYYTAANGWKRQAEQTGKLRVQAQKEKLADAQKEIDDGWAEYNNSLDEWRAGLEKLGIEEADLPAELSAAKQELEDAQEKLDGISEPEWFVYKRKDGVDFDSYYQDTMRLEKIGYVFPLVFFLVAVMVSLTTMTRMVEDHRTQIGVYKALGYRPAAIMMKYIIYALSASGIGGVIGALFGSWLFPTIISDAYGHLYAMPPISTPVPMGLATVAVCSAVLAVVAVTLLMYIASMRGSPALLMRPKSPAKGKRVLLERAGIIWKHLGFFSKVSARNTFRYKKRFIMTLAGVASCAALLITAFGLRDSINGVGNLQYETIVKYDARVYLKDITTQEQRGELDELLPSDRLYIREEAVRANGKSGGLSASLVVPDVPEKLPDYISLHPPKSKEPLSMTGDSVLITDKLSRVMGVGVGDDFTMTLPDGSIYTAVVTGVVDNYLHHYIYMSPAVYSKLSGEALAANGVMIYNEDGRDVAAPLLENENVRAFIKNDELKSQIVDQTDVMGIAIYVLIALACALAFVVLFTLSNINISERTRELATIKVLGFYDNELFMYVFRENGLVIVLGILLGLVGGFFLHGFVIATVEIDVLKFPQTINLLSYVIAVGLSVVFAVFVSLVMNIKLARIDMVESLKNVE